MKREIYIRDRHGVPVKAKLLRPVRIKKGFTNLGLTVNSDGYFAVTELRSGASIAFTHFTREAAIDAAREKVSAQTPESFKKAIEQVLSQFGELPAIDEAASAVQP